MTIETTIAIQNSANPKSPLSICSPARLNIARRVYISTLRCDSALTSTNQKARVAFRQRALLLAKRSRAARSPTLSLSARVVTLKTGEVLPVAPGRWRCGGELRANGAARHEVFARVGVAGRRWWSGHRAFGFGDATVGGDVLFGAVTREKQREETAGRGLESAGERAVGRRGCCCGEVAFRRVTGLP